MKNIHILVVLSLSLSSFVVPRGNAAPDAGTTPSPSPPASTGVATPAALSAAELAEKVLQLSGLDGEMHQFGNALKDDDFVLRTYPDAVQGTVQDLIATAFEPVALLGDFKRHLGQDVPLETLARCVAHLEDPRSRKLSELQKEAASGSSYGFSRFYGTPAVIREAGRRLECLRRLDDPVLGSSALWTWLADALSRVTWSSARVVADPQGKAVDVIPVTVVPRRRPDLVERVMRSNLYLYASLPVEELAGLIERERTGDGRLLEETLYGALRAAFRAALTRYARGMTGLAAVELKFEDGGGAGGPENPWGLLSRPPVRLGSDARHLGGITEMRFRSGGKLLALGTGGVIRIIDGTTGRLEKELATGIPDVRCFASSSNGAVLAVGASNGWVSVFDMASMKQTHLLIGLTDRVTGLTVSADGTRVFGSGATGRPPPALWDLGKGTGAGCEALPYLGLMEPDRVAFSNDATKLLFGGMAFGVLSVTSMEPVAHAVQLPRWDQRIEVSPSGELIASVSNRGVLVFRVSNGELVLKIEEPGASLAKARFSADDRRIVITSGDRTQVWELDEKKKIWSIKHPGKAKANVALSHDGMIVAVASGPDWNQEGSPGVELFQTESGQAVLPATGHRAAIAALDVSRSGKKVFSVSIAPEARVWSLPAEGGAPLSVDAGSGLIRMQPDGEAVISVTRQLALERRTLADGKTQILEGRVYEPRALVIAPNAKKVAYAGSYGSVYLLDTETTSSTGLRFGLTNINHVEISGDGQMVMASGYNESVQLRSLANPGDDLLAVSWGLCAALAPGGKRVAVGTRGIDGAIIKLARTDGTAEAWLQGHEDSISALTFLSDDWLLSGSHDGSLRLWHVPTERQVTRLDPGVGPVRALARSPDGAVIVAGGDDGSVLVWQGAK